MNRLKYLVPNLVTAAALACGVVAIALAMDGQPLEATWWVLYATLLDRMDGAIARALDASSETGSQLDSFADFVSFGLAPTFLFLGAFGEGIEPLLLVPMLVYIMGAALRLGRFNLSAAKDFSGVPSTMVGGIYAVAVNVALQYEVSAAVFALPFAALLVLFGLLMNAPFMRFDRVGAHPNKGVNVAAAVLLLICAVLIVSRQLPELLLGLTAPTLVFGPLFKARS